MSVNPKIVSVIIAVGLIAAASALCAQGRTQVVFEREVIMVFLDETRITVKGTYFFKNKHIRPVTQRLFYPFPVDSLHPAPDSVTVHAEGKPVPFRSTGTGVVFSVTAPAAGSVMVTVVYEQDCLDNTGCYILTSTSKWENPLKEAEFDVFVPQHVELTSMTYEADLVRKEKNYTVSTFHKNNFLPKKDLCLEWRLKE
jgi:hypothetical protein